MKTAEEILRENIETFRQDFNYEDDVLKAMKIYAEQVADECIEIIRINNENSRPDNMLRDINCILKLKEELK